MKGKEVVPGITAVGTHGHSWAHNSHIIASGSDRVFVQGDVTHVRSCLAQSRVARLLRSGSGRAEATRRRVYDMLVAEKMPVQGFHFPFPALAYIEKSGSGYREIAVPWNPVL